MRALILVTGVLALAACSNNDQHDNTINVDENLTAENIVSNDVTAIDAVTGSDANMAAAAEINDVAPVNSTDLNMPAPAKPATSKSPPKQTASKPKPKPAPKPTTTTPPTANATE